jgi:hypothetical protein
MLLVLYSCAMLLFLCSCVQSLLLLLLLLPASSRTCQLSAAREAPTDQACMGLALLLSIMRQPAQHTQPSQQICAAAGRTPR